MKALRINPEQQTIDEIEISGHDDIVRLIGFDTVISDEIGPDGDRLYFDEDCFLRGSSARFQIDTVVPVAGTGVVVGMAADGEQLQDVTSDLEGLRKRLKYL
jgi:hypothetical protein